MTASSPPIHSRSLQWAVRTWFTIVVIGQLIFALYIFGLYGVSGLAGDFERWGEASTHGYVPDDFWGNLLFAFHVALALIVTLGGPLQLLERVRRSFPKFHRINGRIYITAAFLISLAGFYLVWVRGTVGGMVGNLSISLNGLLIFICAYYTFRRAVARQFEAHRQWAIRLFLVMSGVWFFRVFLMFWLAVNQGPIGIDLDTFEGPAITSLNIICYVLPIVVVEFYFRALQNGKITPQRRFSVFLWLLNIGIAVGTLAATLGMWLPSI